jgi:hypothetical protein
MFSQMLGEQHLAIVIELKEDAVKRAGLRMHNTSFFSLGTFLYNISDNNRLWQ